MEHNGRPVYRGGRQCILYEHHWKIANCHKMEDRPLSEAIWWSEVNAECPEDIGTYWRNVEGSDSSFSVTCLGVDSGIAICEQLK